MLLDAGSFSEEAQLANWDVEGLGADGVVTGLGTIGGRRVALMANDPTVKAGSWGAKTVEKIIRIQERALSLELPMVYLVDSAGARITDQVQMFPGRRGAGRIFHNEVRMSGRVPQVCVLFGPSAAGGAYIPAFCDVVVMRDGNASMYLGSPRMAEMVIGEQVTLEEMGGARMHTGVSGCGHFLAKTDEEAIGIAQDYLAYMPTSFREDPPSGRPGRARRRGAAARGSSPPTRRRRSTSAARSQGVCDAGTFLEIHARWAKELVVGYARLDGRAIGIVANQPTQKGGVLFVDSADKAARFINTCNAFNIPLLFLADVPGFMIGKAVERQGIIRHGAKMVSAVSSATVPKISVVVRKAYGAGLYAMAGPAFEPDACIALPEAQIAVMGPGGGDQRGLLQPDPGDRRRGRAGRVRRRASAPSTPSRHRHPPPRLRARHRLGDRARRAARRADPPLRGGGRQGSPLQRAAQPDHARPEPRRRSGALAVLGVRVVEAGAGVPLAALVAVGRESRPPASASPRRASGSTS